MITKLDLKISKKLVCTKLIKLVWGLPWPQKFVILQMNKSE